MCDNEQAQVRITVESQREISLLCGREDENLKLMEKELGVEFVLRDNLLRINGNMYLISWR